MGAAEEERINLFANNFVVILGNPHSGKPEPKVSPEKFREFTYLKTPKKKYDPLSVVTG